MRFIKPLLIALSGLFLLLSLISLVMPAEVRLLRSASIHAPKDSIQILLAEFKRWPEWQSFLKEPSLKYAVASDGQSASWYVKGEKHIVRKIENPLKGFAFTISRHDAVSVEYYFTLLESGGPQDLQLQWAVSLHTRWYPWERFSGLLFEQAAGPGIEAALQDLKLISEK